MNRLIAAGAAIAALALAACGSSGNAAGNASSSSTSAAAGNGQGAARLGRNGAAGELVQINGSTLVLNTTNGDVTVKIGGSTPVTQTRTGTVADIVVGTCIVATGKKDSSGAVTANTVRVSPAVNGSCAGPGLGFGGQARNGATPRADATPNPNRMPNPNAGLVRGLVTAVSGTTVSVRDPRGTSGSVTVPTTVRVTTASTGSTADLTLGQCVLAVGSKDAAGAVSASALSIVPAGPSGCFTGGNGRGFGGGFGGGSGAGSGGGSGGGQAQPAD